MMTRNPGFTLAAVLTLALGIGANTALFSFIRAAYFPIIPLRDLNRVVAIYETGAQQFITDSNYDDWWNQMDIFEAIAADKVKTAYAKLGPEPERMIGYAITRNFFQVLGTQPFLGRSFLPEEEQPGAQPTVILSYSLWHRLYGDDQQVLGKTIVLNGQTYQIVGVMGRDMRFLFWNPQFWVSLGQERGTVAPRSGHRAFIYARLKPGVTIEQAQARVNVVAKQMKESGGYKLKVSAFDSWQGSLKALAQSGLPLLMWAVFFVLLIACANIANLLLARAVTREKEIAVRVALGAGRGRLIRQLLTETTLLCILGGCVGVLLNHWLSHSLAAMIPEKVFRINQDQIHLNGTVLVFTGVLCVFTGLTAGLAPALEASKVDLQTSLKECGQKPMTGFRGHRLRNLFIISEIALAIILLIGAALLFKSMNRLANEDPGFNPQPVLIVSALLPPYRYTDAQVGPFFKQMLENVKMLPVVQSAALINDQWTTVTTDEGKSPPGDEDGGTSYAPVSSDFFQTIGARLLVGRFFNQGDDSGSPVAVINERAARTFWPGKSAIGRHIRMELDQPRWLEVVGIVKNMKQEATDTQPVPMIYVPYSFDPSSWNTALMVRSHLSLSALAPTITDQIWSIDKQVVLKAEPMEQVLGESLAEQRFFMRVLALFAGIAIFLAVIGIYAVLAYSVGQQRHEIGVRMSLGAQHKDVILMILRQGLTLVLTGTAIGIAFSLAANRLLKTFLYSISPMDIPTYAAVTVIVMVVSMIACAIPAFRAGRTDPSVALRNE